MTMWHFFQRLDLSLDGELPIQCLVEGMVLGPPAGIAKDVVPGTLRLEYGEYH